MCTRLTIFVALSEWNKNVVSPAYKQELNNLETDKAKEEFKESCQQYYLDHRHETLSDQTKGSQRSKMAAAKKRVLKMVLSCLKKLDILQTNSVLGR